MSRAPLVTTPAPRFVLVTLSVAARDKPPNRVLVDLSCFSTQDVRLRADSESYSRRSVLQAKIKHLEGREVRIEILRIPFRSLVHVMKGCMQLKSVS